MRRFYHTTYKFHADKSCKIFILSDIHFSPKFKDEKIDRICKFVASKNPDYIFIPGDTLDCNDSIFEDSEKARLRNFFEKLGSVAPVLLSKGNHDFYKTRSGDRRLFKNWQITQKGLLKEALKDVKNVHFLDNSAYEDQNIFVFGFTQQPGYYNFNSDGVEKASVLRPTHELLDEMIRELEEQDFSKLPQKKLKFLLVHSPVYLRNQKVLEKINGFDYFISGHMHNGLVPPFLEKIWPGTRGIISPTRNFLELNVRNTIRSKNDKSIVVGAVTTFHENSIIFRFLNSFYPIYTSLLDFSPKNKKDPKVLVAPVGIEPTLQT